MSMNENMNASAPVSTDDEPVFSTDFLAYLADRYDRWLVKYTDVPPAKLIIDITRQAKMIAEKYPTHSVSRKLELTKLGAMQDAAIRRMS